MSNVNDEETSRPGLTKPLINNVGGVIDQDAPSADQLLEHSPDNTWSEANVTQGSTAARDHSGTDDDGVIPTFDRTDGRQPDY